MKSIPFATILADVKEVDDFIARKIVLSENIQREDLTPIEEIYAFADYVDMLMCKNEEYAKIDKPPIERLAWVLMKMHSDTVNKTDFMNNFVHKTENSFASLPRPVQWQSFYLHNLKSYLKMDDEVKDVAVKHKLKKSQAKA